MFGSDDMVRIPFYSHSQRGQSSFSISCLQRERGCLGKDFQNLIPVPSYSLGGMFKSLLCECSWSENQTKKPEYLLYWAVSLEWNELLGAQFRQSQTQQVGTFPPCWLLYKQWNPALPRGSPPSNGLTRGCWDIIAVYRGLGSGDERGHGWVKLVQEELTLWWVEPKEEKYNPCHLRILLLAGEARFHFTEDLWDCFVLTVLEFHFRSEVRGSSQTQGNPAH